MKKITLLFLMCVALTSQLTAQLQVGDGENQLQALPIDPYFEYSYTQSIYLANELNSGAGIITGLQYYFSGTSSLDDSQDLTIYVGHTSKSSFSDSDDWIDVTTLTASYAGGIPVAGQGWVTLTLDTPFVYNGTDNIVIAVTENSVGYDGFGDDFWNTATSEARSIYYRNDNNPITISDPETATGTASYVPTVIIDGITALCTAAAATVTSVVEDCDNSQFSILVDVTDLGDSTNLEITNDAGVTSTTVTATGEVTVGPFPVGIPVVLTLENENNDLCDVVLDSVLDFCPTAANTLDYYNLQFPATLTFAESEVLDQIVYAQAYDTGLTDTTVGEAAAGIEVWIGYSATNTDPSSDDWTWEVATFNAEVGNNDEYALNILDLGLEVGVYYYASRFSLNEGPYTYGGFGGAWDGTINVSGLLTITPGLPPVNDDLANAIAVTCGDTVSGITTYATIDEADATIDISTSSDIDSPNLWYSFMGTGEIVTLSTCTVNTTFDTEILVFTGNSGSLVAVSAGYDECALYRAETTFTSIAGTQYYIAIEGFNLANIGAFDLEVTCEPAPTCTNATATYSIVSDCETSGGFNIEVDITDMGTATDLTVTDDQGNDAQAVTEATTLTFGPYVNGTDVVITIADDNDETCEQSSDTLTQTVCPPSNDECAGAEALTLGTTVAGSTVGATGAASSSCDGTIGNDVWYTVTGDGGDMTITVNAATVDQQIGVFESEDCAGITLGSCLESATGFSNPESVTFTSTAGTNYYIQVGAWSSSSADSDFSITIETTLSTTDFETEAAFTYYPNPVKNTLSLNAQNSIEQVTMYNMLGQEVLRATPNTVDS
ncbi:T9SS type A sorting domain-containing protein, partial [Nonlabens ulvanivorans]|uniref:T9SS type A sorting domain-containing protein n=1 Tax=Nonlabens ulvanivorans TaxID=906888 RepID=UPI0032995DEF